MNIMDRKFGCEFEFSTEYHDLFDIINPKIDEVYGKKTLKSLETYAKSRNNYTKWHLKTDSSTECELCTNITSFRSIQKIGKIIKHLDSAGTKITNKDSFHIHIQADDISAEKILICWLAFEKTIVKCFPKHRRKNTYCKILGRKQKNNKIIDYLPTALKTSLEHHSIMSLKYYQQRKTFEIRLSHGSTDFSHIYYWTKFCLYFAEFCKNINTFNWLQKTMIEPTIEQMFKTMEIKQPNMLQWFLNLERESNS